MSYTSRLTDLMFTLIETFTNVYDFFLTDLGQSTGLALLDGVTIIQAMFGVGLSVVLTYTLVKWVAGVIT